jgi:hypothetical protein
MMMPITETNQILDLPDKDFKVAIIKMLQKSIIDSLETKEKISFKKQTEIRTKNQI